MDVFDLEVFALGKKSINSLVEMLILVKNQLEEHLVLCNIRVGIHSDLTHLFDVLNGLLDLALSLISIGCF